MKNLFNKKIKKKEPFGVLLSSFFRILRDFIRKIKIFINGNYFVTNKKSYIGDGMASNHVFDFLHDNKFINAYNEGKKTGAIKFHPTEIHYRAYFACYFSKFSSKLDGDFVECGAGRGLLTKTIITYLNFEKINKSFYLFDTFKGIPVNQASTEAEKKTMEWFNNNIHFTDDYFDDVVKTFSNYANVKLIKGTIPDCLNNVQIDKISFLSMDMNNAFAEIKSIEFFWDKIVKHGIVLLDDYAYAEAQREQKNAWDNFAKSKNFDILTLPTGQGLIIKD
jgi:O-methyltransferase